MAKAQTAAPAKRTRAAKAAPPVEAVLKGGEEPVTEEQRAAERRAHDLGVQARRENADAMAFSVQQMTAPATVTDGDLDTFQKAVQALAQVHNVPPEVVAAVVPAVAAPMAKAAKNVKNGVTRPNNETKCGKIWTAADEITVKTRAPATLAELRQRTELKDVNEHTIKTQYARWRQYNGITGRVTKATPASPAGEDEGLAAAHK